MSYEVRVAHSVKAQIESLSAARRASVIRAMRLYLAADPTHVSASRIKRLRGLRCPQYRLRVDDVRVFYDVSVAERAVDVLAIIEKARAAAWLDEHGDPE